MRIYLACTVRGNRDRVAAGRLICSRLEAHGHEVLTKHLLADDIEAAESMLLDEDVYRRDMRWLSQCDALVAEASGSSYGVGYEVGLVLGSTEADGRRVVLFYDQARSGAISRLIVGNSHERCTRLPYTSLEELERFIDREFGP